MKYVAKVSIAKHGYPIFASFEFDVGELGRVKSRRSRAKRTLDADEFIRTLSGSGQAKLCCAWLPSPSGGEDFPASGRGEGWGIYSAT